MSRIFIFHKIKLKQELMNHHVNVILVPNMLLLRCYRSIKLGGLWCRPRPKDKATMDKNTEMVRCNLRKILPHVSSCTNNAIRQGYLHRTAWKKFLLFFCEKLEPTFKWYSFPSVSPWYGSAIIPPHSTTTTQ